MSDIESPETEGTLDHFWNQLDDGSTLSDWTGPDQEIAEAIGQILALDTAPLPESSRERIRRGWQQIERSNYSEEDFTMLSLAIPATQSANGRNLSPPARSVAQPRALTRHQFVAMAAVAVLLLSLIAGFDRYGSGWLGNNEPTGGTVIMAPATPKSETAEPSTPDDSLLVRTTIQPDAYPTGGGNGSGMSFYRIPEGVTSSWDPASTANGPLMQFIVVGFYNYTSESPIQVIHAAGWIEDVPANVEVRLQAGDALIGEYDTPSVSKTLAVAGPVELLEWTLVGGGTPFDDVHPEWEWISGDGWGPMELPDSPGTLELRTLQVRAGENIPPFENGIRFIVSTNPAILVNVGLDTTVDIMGAPRGIYTVYLVTFVPESGEIVYTPG